MTIRMLKPLMFSACCDEAGNPMLTPRKDPLLKGWDAADALAEGWTPAHIGLLAPEQFVKYVVPERDDAEASAQPDRLETHLLNYSIVGGDLCIGKSGKGGELELKAVSSALIVTANTRDQNNESWGRLVEFPDRDGIWHELAIPAEMLSGKSGESCFQALLSRGVDIYEDMLLRKYLIKAKPPARALCVKQVGWHGKVFALPERNYGQSDERIILQSKNLSRNAAYGTKGTLKEWQVNVASLCEGNSRLILAITVALAGPFLKGCGIENGGFHFRGKSSTGKSKTLFVAASVWGDKTVVKLWRTTDNAIESLAYSANDTLLCLDELGQVDPAKAGDIAYTLGNGRSKARATQSGEARDITDWRLLYLSTGEIGLASHMAVGGKQVRAGQEIRMLDIPADAGAGLGVFENIHNAASGAKFSDSLQQMADQHYGTAGDALLSRITEDGEMDKAIEFIEAEIQAFISAHIPASAHGQIQRAGGRFAFVAAVGEYCIEVGILPFAKGEAAAGVLKCFQAWVDERGGDQDMESIRAIAQVRSFIEAHGESRFSSIDLNELSDALSSEGNVRTNQRVGFRKSLGNGLIEYWVFSEAYNKEICRGFDPKVVTKVLMQNGFLQLDGAGRPQISKRLPGIGLQRVYVIKPSILQSDDEEAQPLAA